MISQTKSQMVTILIIKEDVTSNTCTSRSEKGAERIKAEIQKFTNSKIYLLRNRLMEKLLFSLRNKKQVVFFLKMYVYI